ncbi:AAA family ATPase [Pseudolactococcus plantarum]|jgi:predicted ABC-type ATPase|uniref:Kinase n=1 Tax=Pseudolactococcus plantarum TaxID=1365 RepID=A0A2A5S283_9LACT|nr:AAA family ATPase [Lactococcus plantarum]PCS07606.1 kinase [Lactococcus plantarum]
MSKIIVLRGNSGSGKTTVANKLHKELGEGNLLISQDYVRRTMLQVKDKPNNLAIGLLDSMIKYGIRNCDYTIVEGILSNNKYGKMLRENVTMADNVYAYYYDLSFEETVKRHITKKNVDFNTEDMLKWFTPKDLLGIKNEKSITKDISEDNLLELILNDLKLS